ncbi:hypothetical protein [Roseiterribacter gracilis]|uniref:Uncharacterized protein n=1 Tax=Roseiterribacter gracilis TaxID=2812848 RepID=A0A8S8XA07_9PROT|nr:hypothetical protein TMPK1_18210 [Rhodospirillales bacterium TMPK1]
MTITSSTPVGRAAAAVVLLVTVAVVVVVVAVPAGAGAPSPSALAVADDNAIVMAIAETPVRQMVRARMISPVFYIPAERCGFTLWPDAIKPPPTRP